MDKVTSSVLEVDDMLISYEEFASDIVAVLELGFHLPLEQAEAAVRMADLRPIFESDPEMALHTSYDKWAKEVLTCWERHRT